MSPSSADSRSDAAAALAARGDTAAFEMVCHLLRDDVWRYCLALVGDPALAEEAAQETFVRAVTAIRRFRGECPARVYLLVLARRSCSAVLRREERHRTTVPLATADEPAGPATGGAIETALLLRSLPVDLRQAFVLTQILGLTYDEAGRVCGCPVGTIRSRVYRARERLVAALDPAEQEDRDVR